MSWTAIGGQILSGCVVVIFAALVARLGTRSYRQTQDVIADRLDTATPGGLGDLVAVNRTRGDTHGRKTY